MIGGLLIGKIVIQLMELEGKEYFIGIEVQSYSKLGVGILVVSGTIYVFHPPHLRGNIA